MKLYLIRHAHALSLGTKGITRDADRPLSETGRGQCKPLAEALSRQNGRPARLVSSPLVRARQTAEGMVAYWPKPVPEVVLCDELAPGGKRRRLLRFLKHLQIDELAVVGHNPDLSIFLAWLIGANKTAQLDLAKAGSALVEFEGDPEKGAGVLHWMVTPAWYGGPASAS
jgi:phosphohistidine phosphatase